MVFAPYQAPPYHLLGAFLGGLFEALFEPKQGLVSSIQDPCWGPKWGPFGSSRKPPCQAPFWPWEGPIWAIGGPLPELQRGPYFTHTGPLFGAILEPFLVPQVGPFGRLQKPPFLPFLRPPFEGLLGPKGSLWGAPTVPLKWC